MGTPKGAKTDWTFNSLPTILATILPGQLGRFYRAYNNGGGDECWEWKGPRDSDGGRFYWNYQHRQRVVSASRLAYYLITRKDLGKEKVRHTCGNNLCMNPAHLEI